MMYARKFAAALVMASICFVGCDKESSKTTTTETKTPGGDTKTTTSTKVEMSGSAPPAAGH